MASVLQLAMDKSLLCGSLVKYSNHYDQQLLSIVRKEIVLYMDQVDQHYDNNPLSY